MRTTAPKAEVWIRSGICLYVKIPPKSRCIQILSLKFFQNSFPVRCLARQRHWFDICQRKLQHYSRTGQSFKIQYSHSTHKIYVHSYEIRSSLCVCGKLVPGPARIQNLRMLKSVIENGQVCAYNPLQHPFYTLNHL